MTAETGGVGRPPDPPEVCKIPQAQKITPWSVYAFCLCRVACAWVPFFGLPVAQASQLRTVVTREFDTMRPLLQCCRYSGCFGPSACFFLQLEKKRNERWMLLGWYQPKPLAPMGPTDRRTSGRSIAGRGRAPGSAGLSTAKRPWIWARLWAEPHGPGRGPGFPVWALYQLGLILSTSIFSLALREQGNDPRGFPTRISKFGIALGAAKTVLSLGPSAFLVKLRGGFWCPLYKAASSAAAGSQKGPSFRHLLHVNLQVHHQGLLSGSPFRKRLRPVSSSPSLAGMVSYGAIYF